MLILACIIYRKFPTVENQMQGNPDFSKGIFLDLLGYSIV
jgi:hypothetical protein